ncbi:MAG: T9SS type A sorting domain-containing protein [Bacteroidia bacterium]
MNKQLQNKLKTYAALTTSASVIATAVDAQIVHTVVNYTGGYETYNIDIDNDGNVDFVVNGGRFTYSFTYSSNPITVKVGNLGLGGVLSVNRMIGYSSSYFNVISGLASGVLVNYANSFISSGALAGTYEVLTTFYGVPITLQSGAFGQFGDGSEKFVGVQFEIPASGNIHYGWLRFKDVASDGSAWTLVDMAYNTLAVTDILTGQTTAVGVKENNIAQFSVSNIEGGIMLKNSSDLLNADVELLDVSGRILFESTINSNEMFIENKYNSGIYFLRISFNGKAITRKVVF